jgi:hypothetical protein
VSNPEEAGPNRLRRLEDVISALEDVPEGAMPPIRVLFRLSELGVKDPASLTVDVLRKRVQAIKRLYIDRVDDERRALIASAPGKRSR